MTKGELQEKANQFNSKASQFNAPNKFDVSSSVRGLSSAWETSSGIESVGKIKGEIGRLEESLSNLERIANGVKAVQVNVSFYETEEEEVV